MTRTRVKTASPVPIPTSWAEVLQGAEPRPTNDDTRANKKNYAERLSRSAARFVAQRLRSLGASEVVPGEEGGDEKRFAGGIGDKKVDVSLASESHGLILAVEIKSINYPDAKTGNFQKNLTNRRGDMLAEATSLHQRFPYAVVGGLFLFEHAAAEDGTERRLSTVQTAHQMFASFSGRRNRTDGTEMYEAIGIVLYRAGESDLGDVEYYAAGAPTTKEAFDLFLERLLRLVAGRNPDSYRYAEGRLCKAGKASFDHGS